jgi:hypothetical protein
MQKIVGEIFFYYITFVPTAHDKIIDSMRGVHLHDVPQDWHAANFNHGLGLYYSFFGNSSTKTSSQKNSFHVLHSKKAGTKKKRALHNKRISNQYNGHYEKTKF